MSDPETARGAPVLPRRVAVVVALVVAGLLTLALLLAGLAAVVNALSTPWLLLAIGAFVVVATVPVLARWSLRLLCAAVVSLLALVGFNVLFGLVVDWRFSVKAGLVVGLGVFAVVAFAYLAMTWAWPKGERHFGRRLVGA